MSGKKEKGTAKESPRSQASEEDLSFEEALERLEELVEGLEEGDQPLEETLRAFEEGQKLLRLCTRLLGQAETRVKEILRQADGGLEEREWKGEKDDTP